ncbi:CHASE2 domain-containing protein [Phormidesmis priestleyi ULC007]|uniref:CHASE2 domain-containing protein n=1 Tax=Phormidesmis priestleyi ULC007 TaxID=1920490 RepID=A0A2T1D800_9CYAN|nr:CHASE2 domain-containing protein [Phormidesmis priestleyi]PSB16620.1 CHASE2 domain-containing protein [Phormidesmis priestleyi ULC007]PZO47524.1 MAG: CHASE2 domain-containing protein [Phormidesmis priestleyi]
MADVNRSLGTRLKNESSIWRIGALPGVVIIGLVIAARLTGVLQWLEWRALDQGLRLRPAEPVDERILIVGINEADIRRIGTYPIPDRDLAALLKTLQTYQPAAIGLDIVRDLPVQPGHKALVQALRDKRVIAIEKLPDDKSGIGINPPPTLPAEQVGFVDALFDTDGILRRSLLGASDLKGDWHSSLSLRLAEAFLLTKNLSLENGIHDPEAMRFGSTELIRFQPNFGSYVRADAGGSQVLLNFRSGRNPFRIVSLQDIQLGQVNPKWIRDRIVLIGMTAPSTKDVVSSSAIVSDNPALIYGVEIQAHAISQIVSATLDQRPLLNVWSDGWEYVWIIAWGILGISLGRFIRAPLWILLGLTIACITLIGISYGLLLLGWWIPVAPALLVLVLNSAGLAAFYRYDQDLRSRLQDRQRVIDYTFNTIHNGPLQTLATLLRQVQSQDLPSSQMLSELQQLNQELRSVYDSVRRDALMQGDQFYLSHDRELNLQEPMHEVLYEVYTNVMERDLPCFKSLKVQLVTFEPMNERRLSVEQKRGLCRFLEEALCNVGKHAVCASRLEVKCIHAKGRNLIQVMDNGRGYDSSLPEGMGTQQARSLTKQLQGVFVREVRSTGGTLCELSWSVRKARFWRF